MKKHEVARWLWVKSINKRPATSTKPPTRLPLAVVGAEWRCDRVTPMASFIPRKEMPSANSHGDKLWNFSRESSCFHMSPNELLASLERREIIAWLWRWCVAWGMKHFDCTVHRWGSHTVIVESRLWSRCHPTLGDSVLKYGVVFVYSCLAFRDLRCRKPLTQRPDGGKTDGAGPDDDGLGSACLMAANWTCMRRGWPCCRKEGIRYLIMLMYLQYRACTSVLLHINQRQPLFLIAWTGFSVRKHGK